LGFRTIALDRPVSLGEAERLAQRLESSALVELASPDSPVSLFEGVDTSQVDAGPEWGLDRIDQRSATLNSTYQYDNTGLGVSVYVADTGIRSSHNEFGGRVGSGFSALTGGTEDCHGHGTHVAGIVGGLVYGVAKQAQLIPVRVLGCDGRGSASDVIAGLTWIRENRVLPGVVVLSLGGSPNNALDEAVSSVISAGLSVVVASGNDAQDACQVSPARVPQALTVNALDRGDAAAVFTNYGACTDIYAPGVDIRSAGLSSDSSLVIRSGTSMAAPHVAGVVARILQVTPALTPVATHARVLSDATSVNVRAGDPADSKRVLYLAPGTGAPATPLITTVSSGSAAVSVSWDWPTSSGASAVTGYTARAWDLPAGGTRLGQCTTATRSCTISGLTGNTTYFVDVIATNAEGDSQPGSRQLIRVLSTPSLEFVFAAKTTNQIQFGICHNISGVSASGWADLSIVVRQGSTEVPWRQDWAILPGVTFLSGPPGPCTPRTKPWQNSWPAWNSVSGLQPNTTYTFEATYTWTPRVASGSAFVDDLPNRTVYTATQQVNTGGGCPVGAPDDTILRRHP